ncbi:single-stranded DNA-binding protein [Corynebacterium coyleae]|uniref:single-stranded DNA-binding protein n=1 Tax=Corynebacterium coyleae TaxID=53374 RepID=UPI00254AADEB|nr:single-stranded DNA-binding protein [Corynebacterium coyleae]MDK8242147.1 single-stranded DNA-binding protein [Corynebacterium coyleae]
MATTTLVGNVTADPELKQTQDGTDVARFSLAWSERQKSGDDWIDGPTTFVRCSVWGRMAKHIAHNLAKGTCVLVTGEMRAEEWASDKGPQTDVIMNVRHLGVSLEFADVTITKREKSGGAGAFGQGSAQQDQGQQGQAQGQPTGWQVQDSRGGFGNNTDQAPF